MVEVVTRVLVLTSRCLGSNFSLVRKISNQFNGNLV